VWGASSDFIQPIGSSREEFEINWPSVRLDDLAAVLGLGLPDFMKIDVDGGERQVLLGATSVLKTVRSLIIEVNDPFGHGRIDDILMSTGLYKEPGEHRLNQIWSRKD